jgi:hypothetical protein
VLTLERKQSVIPTHLFGRKSECDWLDRLPGTAHGAKRGSGTGAGAARTASDQRRSASRGA